MAWRIGNYLRYFKGAHSEGYATISRLLLWFNPREPKKMEPDRTVGLDGELLKKKLNKRVPHCSNYLKLFLLFRKMFLQKEENGF